ncbi:MAG: TonB-dependent receptor domain-containing protein [Flavobacteriales bacterium]
MFKIVLTFSVILSCAISSWSQTTSISGQVTDKADNSPLPFVAVRIQDGSNGGITDETGNYSIAGLKPGLYNVVCEVIGYKSAISYEVEVTIDRPAILNFQLEQDQKETEVVEIVGSNISNREESPISIRTIGTNEIKRNPGGNRDISRAIRSLPGVAAVPSFRNDIIIRGGAANENRFYIDGIEIPVINHFSTQGASGGPVGMLNVDLIKEVEFYSGAFPANRGNALSSVLEFEIKEARTDKYTANVVLGSSDIAVAAEGPTGKNSGLIVSARRSYLQGLFKVLGLPFLPTYNDFQFKWKTKIDDKNQLTILGLGAIDQFDLNLDLDNNPDDENFARNAYLLSNLPINEQWNYTVGTKWDRYTENGKWTFVLSRNALQNDAYKYTNNDAALPRTFDYTSREEENKLRIENKIFGKNGWKLVYGVGYEYAQFTIDNVSKRYLPSIDSTIAFTYEAALNLNRYGAFLQSSKTLLNSRLIVSAGFRADGNSFNKEMQNPLNQLSPRVSARFSFAPQWSFNVNSGIYYQSPSYTSLGYAENGVLANTAMKYIRNTQLVAGVEYDWNKRNTIITVEGFYKYYENYPVSINNGISLANLGADFGVIGNELLSSTGNGRSSGVEFLYQQRFYKGLYGILAYTYVRSEFTGLDGKYVPSSWDSRHLISVTGGWKFGKNWELGGRFLFSGGLPFTPDNLDASLQIETWNTLNAGIPNWSQQNSQRIKSFQQLDMRIDKKWFFTKWSLDLFFDVQNVLNSSTPLKPTLDVVRDAQGQPVPDPERPGYYQANFLNESSGSFLPSVGVIIEL